MKRLTLLTGLLLIAWAVASAGTPHVHGCAFSVAPTTYEPQADRSVHLLGMELAAYNMLFPDDAYFGTPNVDTGLRDVRHFAPEPYVPPLLLKATGWIESHIAQSDWNTPFGAVGPALVSFDCGHGIMQITSGMRDPQDGQWPSDQQALVGTHYLYNIGRGSVILVDKWNAAPEFRPIAGTNTDSDPTIIENWYFAVWSYNGFTGPGANRSNHPMDPTYEWPRTGYSCGALDDGFGHSFGDFPYQELVFGCASRPPTVEGGQLWTAPSVPLALPDIGDPMWSDPLSLENFVFPYDQMDIQTPLPWHLDLTSRPADGVASLLLGSPTLSVSHDSVEQLQTEVTISNSGGGILAWKAKHDQDWIAIDKQAGVALSPGVPCAPTSPCERTATLRITVVPELAPSPDASAWIDIESLTTGESHRIWILPDGLPTLPPPATPMPTRTPTPTPAPLAGDVNCGNQVNSIDATIILQFSASLIESMACQENGDVNGDGAINPIDAALILQLEAAIIVNLPAQ